MVNAAAENQIMGCVMSAAWRRAETMRGRYAAVTTRSRWASPERRAPALRSAAATLLLCLDLYRHGRRYDHFPPLISTPCNLHHQRLVSKYITSWLITASTLIVPYVCKHQFCSKALSNFSETWVVSLILWSSCAEYKTFLYPWFPCQFGPIRQLCVARICKWKQEQELLN